MNISSQQSAPLKYPFLDPVLEPRESLAELELATRHVSSGDASHLVKKLQAATSQMRLACSRRSIHEEWSPLTCELQSQLLDITFAFSENLDSWQRVRCHTGLLVENDTFLLLSGQLAIENSEHVTLAGSTFDETLALEEPSLGLVQRFTRGVQQGVFRLFGH